MMIGVKLGKAKFYGLMRFWRQSTARITIGNGVTFRSSYGSNLLGINHPCIISALQPDAIIEINDGCGFSGTVIGSFNSIILGKNVRCGANTVITDSDWHPDDPRSSPAKPVFIGDNVWLGANVTVLKGVNIGENSIIGAGSIVTHSIPANVIAAGNPCKVIKTISEDLK